MLIRLIYGQREGIRVEGNHRGFRYRLRRWEHVPRRPTIVVRVIIYTTRVNKYAEYSSFGAKQFTRVIRLKVFSFLLQVRTSHGTFFPRDQCGVDIGHR